MIFHDIILTFQWQSGFVKSHSYSVAPVVSSMDSECNEWVLFCAFFLCDVPLNVLQWWEGCSTGKVCSFDHTLESLCVLYVAVSVWPFLHTCRNDWGVWREFEAQFWCGCRSIWRFSPFRSRSPTELGVAASIFKCRSGLSTQPWGIPVPDVQVPTLTSVTDKQPEIADERTLQVQFSRAWVCKGFLKRLKKNQPGIQTRAASLKIFQGW